MFDFWDDISPYLIFPSELLQIRTHAILCREEWMDCFKSNIKGTEERAFRLPITSASTRLKTHNYLYEVLLTFGEDRNAQNIEYLFVIHVVPV